MPKLKCNGAFAVFLLLLQFSYPAFAEEKPVGRIIGIIGSAEMRSTVSEPVSSIAPGDIKPVAFQPWNKVQPRQLVYLKDELRTGPKSRIRILFNDNSLLALGPNSQMRVSAYQYEPEKKFRKGVLYLVNGLSMYIFNRAQDNKDSSIHIITPTANVAARGTQGIISASREKTIIINEFGKVEVSNEDDEILGKQILGYLQRTDVLRGHPPTPPVNVPQAQYIDAKKMVLGMITRKSDELIEFIEETSEEPVEETPEEPMEETSEEPVEETPGEPVEETSEEPVEETAAADSGSEAAPSEETTTDTSTDPGTTDTSTSPETTSTLDSSTDSLSQELLDTGGTTTDSAFTESYDLFLDTATTTSDSCVAG